MRYLSLFSGIEACTVAWQGLGWECVAFAEIEPFPCALLAQHYPNIPNLGDVTKITENDIKNLGQIDLVVFGSPCQNLSVAGNRKGLQGQSSGLFYDAIRIIEWARMHGNARFALWENVPGAFSSNKGDDFTEVVRALSGNRHIHTPKNGWGNSGVAVGENGLTEWRVLDAQYFGLAQRRKRVFALTDFGAWSDRPPILFERDRLQRDIDKGREKGRKTTTLIGNGIAEVQSEPVFGLDTRQPPARLSYEQAPTLTASCYKEPIVVFVPKLDPIFFEQRYDDRPVVIAKDVAPTLTAGMGTAGINHIYTAYTVHADPTPKVSENVSGTLRSQGGGGIVPPNVVYGFDSKQNKPTIQNELSPTLVASGFKEPVGVIAGNIIGRDDKHGGNQLGVYESTPTLTSTDRHAADFMVRRLMPIECERLMGFDDNYTNIPFKNKPAPNSARYKALGNSMAVPVMRWIGKQICWAIGENKCTG